MPVSPAKTNSNSRYDKSVDTETMRDCLDGSDDRSDQPNCFYQKRDRKDAEERIPPESYVDVAAD